MGGKTSRRLVLVEDDEWTRRGLFDGLEHIDEVEPIAALSHADASLWGERWPHADVVVVGAAGDRDQFDRFTGIRIVQEIRAQCGRDRTTVIVLAGHVRNDLLHLRAAEAGADFIYERHEIRDLARLEETLTRPRSGIRFDQRTATALTAHGLSPSSRLNAGLAYVEAAGLTESLGRLGARDERVLSRRRAISARESLTRIVGVTPVGGGSGAVVERVLPSWRQLTEIVAIARGNLDPASSTGPPVWP